MNQHLDFLTNLLVSRAKGETKNVIRLTHAVEMYVMPFHSQAEPSWVDMRVPSQVIAGASSPKRVHAFSRYD